MPTRLTSLELDASPGNPNAVFAPAVLTTAEINSIPLDNLRAGGIVYNISVGNLQTYTINGWENFALSGGGSDVFDNITVNNLATISTLNVANTATVGGLSTAGAIAGNIITASSSIATTNASINSAGAILGQTLGIAGTTTTNALTVTTTATTNILNATTSVTAGRIYGKQSSVPTFVLGGGGANGTGTIFGSEAAGVFQMAYSGVSGTRPISVIAVFTLVSAMPSAYSVIFTPSPAATFSTATSSFTQQAYIQQQSQTQFQLVSGPASTIPDGIYSWQFMIMGSIT
jgi:hypothetical protein